jgi:hypothetical protein
MPANWQQFSDPELGELSSEADALLRLCRCIDDQTRNFGASDALGDSLGAYLQEVAKRDPVAGEAMLQVMERASGAYGSARTVADMLFLALPAPPHSENQTSPDDNHI